MQDTPGRFEALMDQFDAALASATLHSRRAEERRDFLHEIHVNGGDDEHASGREEARWKASSDFYTRASLDAHTHAIAELSTALMQCVETVREMADVSSKELASKVIELQFRQFSFEVEGYAAAADAAARDSLFMELIALKGQATSNSAERAEHETQQATAIALRDSAVRCAELAKEYTATATSALEDVNALLRPRGRLGKVTVAAMVGLNLGAPALHLWTSWCAYLAHGVAGGIAALLLPVLAEVYWLGREVSAHGVLSVYPLATLAVIGCYAAIAIAARRA